MSKEERKVNQFKDKVVGGTKEAVGKMTHNEEMELKGKAQRLKGEAGEKVEEAKDNVLGKVNKTIDDIEKNN